MGSCIGLGDIIGSFSFNALSDYLGRRRILIFGGFIWMFVDILI